MNPFEFVAIIVLFLSIAGVVVVDRLLKSGRRGDDVQLRLAEQHIQQLTARLTDAERHNDELRQQLEWNRRLLEAQERLLQQLPPPPPVPV